MNIYFEKTAYSVYEDDGLLTVVLTLDKPAYTNFTVQVTDINITTNSKSCSVHVHAYRYVTLLHLRSKEFSVAYLMLLSLSYCEDNTKRNIMMFPYRHVARKSTWGVRLEEKWTSSIIQQQPKRTQLSYIVCA